MEDEVMMDDGGGQSLVEHFAVNKTMDCSIINQTAL